MIRILIPLVGLTTLAPDSLPTPRPLRTTERAVASGANVALGGTVVDAVTGRAIPGAVVSAYDPTSKVSVSVRARGDGRFVIPSRGWRYSSITASAPGYIAEPAKTVGAGVVVRLSPSRAALSTLPSARFLNTIPDDSVKRQFIIDCTGCHVFDERMTHPQGQPRSRASWAEKTREMLKRFGPESPFPIIGPRRDPEKTADWLVASLSGMESRAARGSSVSAPTGDAARAMVTEYDFPEPSDLPHDLALESTGEVVVTGMFTHSMWTLSPASGRFKQVVIPRDGANPRALQVDADGTWWVLLGNPKQVARRDARTQQWSFHDIGVYAHSLARDASGVWFNGHFSAPPTIGHVDEKGVVSRIELPYDPTKTYGTSPIPYELRRGDDGTIWMSELRGNRMLSYVPSSGQIRTFDLPMPHSGPRRFDIAPDGTLWIPTYGYGALARMDPRSGRIMHYQLPSYDAAPYIARVNRRTGEIWVATGAADAVFRFDPVKVRWAEFPLPTRGALVRSMEIEPRTGAVWLAYGASPGIPNKIARLEVSPAGP